MKLSDTHINLKSKTLGLALAAVLIPGGLAMAYDGVRHHSSGRNASGHVEVVRQIPGGVVTVGGEWGRRRAEPPPVIVVQAPRREVIVVEKEHGRGRGRGHGRGHHKDRVVTIIREQPRRNVTIIKTVEARPEVVVIEKRQDRHDACDRNDGRQRNVYVRK